MTEYRIYYGAIEQAYHFILPHIKDVANKEDEIKMIKMPKYKYDKPANGISHILKWKDPDILITAVQGNENNLKERVLFMIEFTTAAYTKDHELQKMDNYIPLMIDDFIHVKISPTKKKAGDHGGDTDFDHTKTYAIIRQKWFKTPYHFEWGVTEDGDHVILDERSLSCPPPIARFSKLLKTAITEFSNGNKNWIDSTLHSDAYYINWDRKINKVDIDDLSNLPKSTRLKYEDNKLTLKINRFGHGMDPERGMLCYYGMLCDNIQVKFEMSDDSKEWYNGTGKEIVVENYINKHGLDTPDDLLYCFLQCTNIKQDDFNRYVERIPNTNKININKFVCEYYEKLSKPLRVIFGFSDMLKLTSKNNKTTVFLSYQRYRGSRTLFQKPIALTTPTYTEDEVTYAIVHRVLAANKMSIISTSYPAAQGDRVMLIEKNQGKGRKQKRDYIDIVFSGNTNTYLHENKKTYSKTKATKDAKKLAKYKQPSMRDLILGFFHRYSRTNHEVGTKHTKIGVGFIKKPNMKIENLQHLILLDYFVYLDIEDNRWTIWQRDIIDDFKVFEGKINLPQIYGTSYDM